MERNKRWNRRRMLKKNCANVTFGAATCQFCYLAQFLLFWKVCRLHRSGFKLGVCLIMGWLNDASSLLNRLKVEWGWSSSLICTTKTVVIMKQLGWKPIIKSSPTHSFPHLMFVKAPRQGWRRDSSSSRTAGWDVEWQQLNKGIFMCGCNHGLNFSSWRINP